LWLGSRGDPLKGGERRPPRPAHHIHSAAQFSISSETENNSSPQSKKAIISWMAGRGQQLETRPPVQGGEGGGRVSFAACRPRRPGDDRQEGRQGGSAGQSFQSAGGQQRRLRPVSPAMRPCGLRRGWRGGPALHRSGGQVVCGGIECKCENAKHTCVKCNKLRCKPRKTAAGSLWRSLSFQWLGLAQWAAASCPLRWRRARTGLRGPKAPLLS
jgi:hypothetical protein